MWPFRSKNAEQRRKLAAREDVVRAAEQVGMKLADYCRYLIVFSETHQERIIAAHLNQPVEVLAAEFYHDPLEDEPGMDEIFASIENELEKALENEPLRTGYCRLFWQTKQRILSARGIDWLTPNQMNPRFFFD